MKNLKKNNKGFSLVELIVVVLIIAIIAVALAPQVIKWVSTATTNTQINNQATIKSAIQTCVADYLGHGGKLGTDDVTVSVTNNTANVTMTSGTDSTVGSLKTLIEAAISGNDAAETFTYKIDKTSGAVTAGTIE